MAANPKALAPELARKVQDWDRECRCIPTFEALRQFEYLRSLGTHNMLTDDITRASYDLGLFEAALWLNECREQRQSWQTMFRKTEPQYEVEHGKRSTWLTPEVLESYARTTAQHELFEAERKMQELSANMERLRRRAAGEKFNEEDEEDDQ